MCAAPTAASTAGAVPAYAGAAPATPATQVFDPNTGQPVDPATGQPLPAAASTPPAPMPLPADAAAQPAGGAPTDASAAAPAKGAAAPDATTPDAAPGATAANLPSWPTWQQAFSDLQLSAADIQRIGEQSLTEAQLTIVHDTIAEELGVPGIGKAGAPAPGAGPTGAWSAEWEQRFAELGRSPEEIAQLRAMVEQQGADEAMLQQLYDQVAQLPAWNQQWEQRFAALGMPQEITAIYAQSGAPASGLQAAYDHAASRLEAFQKTGYLEKFVEQGMEPEQLWSIILADEHPSEKELAKLENELHVGNQPKWKRYGQIGLTFVPGVELAQYAWGRKFLTGETVDRTKPMNIAFAALSALTVFTAARGALNVARGIKAVETGLPALQASGELTRGAAVSDAALGSLQTMSTTQKMKAFVPFTSTHRAVVGWGHAEGAARVLSNGGEAALLAQGTRGSALQAATLGQMFDEIKTGQMLVQGPRISYLGSLKPLMPFKQAGAPVAMAADGSALRFASSMRVGNGSQAVAGMLEAGGTRIAMDPTWLRGGALAGDVAGLSSAHLGSIGQVMGGNAAATLGAGTHSSQLASVVGRVRPGPTEHFARLGQGAGSNPAWFEGFATGATSSMARADVQTGARAAQSLSDAVAAAAR